MMKWYESVKIRKVSSIIRLVIKFLLLAAIEIFLAIALRGDGNKEHLLYLYLALGVFGVFLGGIILITHRKSND